MKILVVDDEKTIVKGIKFNLENEGYQVDVCYDGETAVDMARRGEYAVILLDLMMPKLDGLGACQQIRQFSTVPIIMLTARSEDADKLIGFESGADDYITKPFNILELKARIRALLRRAGAAKKQEPEQKLVCGHITLDRSSRSASFDRVLMVCAASNPMIFPFRTAHSSIGFFFLRNGRPASMVTRASIIRAAPT